MSYCRWSSDDFKCDIYSYADVSGGYTTHVAAFRHAGDIPSVAGAFSEPFDAVRAVRLHKAQSAALDASERVPIGGPHDGETFNDDTLDEFLERLISLRAAGYRFPDWVIESVRAEIAEDASA